MKQGFAQALREHLSLQKKSLRSVARRAGMDPSFLSKLLLGQRNPPDEKRLGALARALEMDEDRLCFLAGRIPERLYALFQKPSFLEEIRGKQTPRVGSVGQPLDKRGQFRSMDVLHNTHLTGTRQPFQFEKPEAKRKLRVPSAKGASFRELTEDLL